MDAVDIARFRALEQSLHRPEVRASRAAVEALLDEGFVEFGSSGSVYDDRKSVIDRLTRETPAAGSVLPETLDFKVLALAPDVVLVTYRSVKMDNGAARSVLRSSIWKRRGSDWRMVFHQGTVVPPATP
jgi:hypothetical protein